MSDFTDRARAEAQTRRDPGGKPCRGWHSRSDAHDKGFVSGAWWAAEQGPSDAEANSRAIARAQWPVLSAGLRELHTRWDQGGGWVVCMHCNDNTSPPRKKQWPCETVTELDRIDRELGIGPERAAPCADHRPVQHRDARPPWCNACGLTEGGEVPTGPLDHRNRS